MDDPFFPPGAPAPAAGGEAAEEVNPYAAAASHIEVKITGYQDVAGFMDHHTDYTVTSRTDLAQYSSNDWTTVTRRYSDFEWLWDTLTKSCPACIIPPLPNKNALGRFDKDFLEQRKRELEKFLSRLASHPVLHTSRELQQFLESRVNLPWQNQGMLAGLGKKIAKATQSVVPVSNISPAEEPDPYFAEKRLELDQWARQLADLSKCTDQLVTLRGLMGQAQGEFARGAKAVSEVEANPPLSRAFGKLSTVATTAEHVYAQQATTDLTLLRETVEEYRRIVDSVKAAMSTRALYFTEWTKARNAHGQRRDALSQATATAGTPAGKVTDAQKAVSAAQEDADNKKRAFDEISTRLHGELDRFDGQRIVDLRKALVDVVESFIRCEDQLIAAWQDLMPDIRAIES